MGDPNNIAKLLDQLSSSTAWQQAVSTGTLDAGLAVTKTQENSADIPTSVAPAKISSRNLDGDELPIEVPSKRVNALLDLLGNAAGPSNAPGTSGRHTPTVAKPTEILANDRPKDPRHLSFAEALPIVTNLAQNPVTIKHLKEIRDEQNRLERRYWDSRQELLQKQRKRIEELKTKVALTGGLGNREIERLQVSFKKELSELEQEEFLPAWDRLLTRQQATLERMKIPLIFETNDVEERRKQQQILNVLEGLMDGPT